MTEIIDIEAQNSNLLLPNDQEQRDISSAVARRLTKAPDVDAAWTDFKKVVESQAEGSHPSNRRTIPSRYINAALAIAAACAILLIWILPKHTEKNTKPGITILAKTTDVTDVTMTSHDGHKQVLDGKNVSFQSSKTSVSEKELPSIILMTTPRGKDCHLTLSDGTTVWMNADSKLEFPEHFSGARRTVRLTGEAYFEVAKDRKHPFVVETEFFTTTVLGTAFNVRAYSANNASVALVEGSVALKNAKGGQQLVLTPGHIATYVKGKRMDVAAVDTYAYTQHKEGYFYFHDVTMRDIMVELGRWYNKTVVFENPADMDLRLHFVAERKQSLPQIINSLTEMDGVDIQLGSNEIVVK